MFFSRLLGFFQINFFENIFQEYSVSEYQTDLDPGKARVLIWVQSVCKGYQ